MDQNERQGRWILGQGLASREQVSAAYQQARARQGVDLAAVLAEGGLLTGAQVRAARAAVAGSSEVVTPPPGAGGSSALAPSPAGSRAAASSALIEPVAGAASSTGGRAAGAKGLSFQEGQRFGRYAVLGEVSRGGMGVVLKARDPESGSLLALKVIQRSQASSALVERFELEARLLLRLKHPNIVAIRDFGYEGDLPFMTMDYVVGEPLKTWVRKSLSVAPEQRPYREGAELMAAVARGLDYCHREGVVHRDLKPDNIMIEDTSGRPLLIDFGVARDESIAPMDALTKTGEVVGTPQYMAPEQLEGGGEITPACDAWSFGGCLFYMLTGENPFRGNSVINIYKAVLAGQVESPRDLNPAAPRALIRLVRECFRRDPRDRPSLADCAERLESFLSAAPRARKRRRGLAITAGALALAGLSAAAYALRPAPSPVLRVKELEALYTREGRLLVKGHLNRFDHPVAVGPLSLKTDERGRFQAFVDLTPGANAIEVRTRVDGRFLRRPIELTYDPDPPELVIEGERMPGLIVLGENAGLGGRVRDRYPVTLTVDDAPVGLDENGAFRIDGARAGSKLRLRCVDPAGNETRRIVELLDADGFAERARAILSDREQWERPDAGARVRLDSAIAWVEERLGSAFQRGETREYRCNGRAHWIAAFRHEATGIVFHLIPGGRYQMGRSESDSPKFRRGEKLEEIDFYRSPVPPHEVVMRPFLIARAELTEGQWARGRDEPAPASPDLPRVKTEWKGFEDWMRSVDARFRFPSESEWEYACRAGTASRFYYGKAFDPGYSWTRENSKNRPRSVALHRARERWNAFGLTDMLGNVYEYCLDGFHPGYDKGPNDHEPMPTTVLNVRVMRGGSVEDDKKYAQCAERRPIGEVGHAWDHVGARVAITIPE